MATTEPKVSVSIDLEAEGKQFGHLSIPHSHNESGWGAVHLPIVSIAGGTGPTVVLTGGNHGDEYEGPIALLKLVRALEPEQVSGRVIVIPALNFPAVMAGTRVSPIDGVNMNRAYPGKRDGSVTQMIAHFVQEKIIPRCQGLMDIHSGGKTMTFSPFAAYHRLEDPELTARCKEAALAAGAPITLELVELDAAGMLDTAVEEAGRVFVSTELGGGGTTTTDTVAIAERAVAGFLGHMGATEAPPPARASRVMHMPDAGCYAIAEEAGLYEALVDLDQPVAKGDAIGQIHFPARPERPPEVYRAGTAGTLIGRSHKVLIAPGDFLGLIAQDI
ncbi:MAG: succinylglutamate desuccinylase/aspartoacylase family protein [Pseudomonadota bacterium]